MVKIIDKQKLILALNRAWHGATIAMKGYPTVDKYKETISITMLLRLLANKFIDYGYYGDMSVGIDKQYLYIRIYRPEQEVIELDLYKGDLLRDQDEEVIIKVAELLGIK